jgi:hypothetical protein
MEIDRPCITSEAWWVVSTMLATHCVLPIARSALPLWIRWIRCGASRSSEDWRNGGNGQPVLRTMNYPTVPQREPWDGGAGTEKRQKAVYILKGARRIVNIKSTKFCPSSRSPAGRCLIRHPLPATLCSRSLGARLCQAQSFRMIANAIKNRPDQRILSGQAAR